MNTLSNRVSSQRTDDRLQGPVILASVKAALQHDLESDEYNKWIEDIRFVAERGGEMLLAVRSDFDFKRVSSAYGLRIEAAWRNADPEQRSCRLLCWDRDAAEFEALVADPWAPAVSRPAPSGGESHMIFDNLIVGDSNVMAVRLAEGIAQGDDVPARLFLINGPQGVGKTHLLRALEAALQSQSALNTAYLSAEEFMSAYVEGVQKGDTSALKARVRGCDLLMLDDIQIIGGKKGTDREIVSTLRAVIAKPGGIAIVTADRPLSELNDLSIRLREELNGAAMIEIKTPDEEMRKAIVRKHADLIAANKPSFFIDDAMCDLVIQKVRGPGRALAGAVRSLFFESRFGDLTVTPEMLDAVILRREGEPRPPSIDMVKRAAMRAFQVSKADLESPRKQRAIVYPRQIAMYLCREMTDKSLPQIGHSFGKRDHTTIMYAHRKITKKVKEDASVAADVERVRACVDEIRQES
ncbi:MAG: DnaA/Hda family protein [Pseudomonadota bacterium]